MPNKTRIFSGNSNKKLAEEICGHLGMNLGKCEVKSFSDGEISVDVKESVRGMDCYVIQSTSTPCNDNLMELLLMLDTLKRASAKSITAVIPYYGYARQDRKISSRTPISAKLVADLIHTAGATRVLCVDLHAGQIQGFFNIPVDNLFAIPVMLPYMKAKFKSDDLVVVSPDAGGVERARAFAKRLDAGLAIIDKRREKANVSEVMHVIGDVKDKICILFDDIIDTAGTITNGANALKEQGAKEIHGCCAHAVLSGPAIERIEDSPIESIITTNSIAPNDKEKCSKLTYLSVGELLGEAIKRINSGESVSSLFS